MIKRYSDIEVQSVRCTDNPAQLICDAASQTMFKDVKNCDSMSQLIKALVKLEHHSPLEHASMTFHIKGCSRSLLAQITRQRTYKFTSSSQHYQDYREYPNVIHQDLSGDALGVCDIAFAVASQAYLDLLNLGVKKEEARQVLPNAAAVNLFVTADARNLMYFFRQRRCARNTAEMIQVADAMWNLCNLWFPELFSLVGPPCVMDGKCNQGSMQADECKKVN